MNQDAYDSIDVVTLPAEAVEGSPHTRKRKRDSAVDGDRPSSGNKRRNRTNFSTEQVKYLEAYFAAEPYPDGMQRKEIALLLTVSQQTVTFWFQNRRARARRMAGNPTVLTSETKKRRELPLQPATNWYFPLTSSTPVTRRRDSSQPITSSPIATPLYPAYYPYPPSIYPPTSEQQTTPPPHPYYPFHPQHVFYPQWILPVSTASTDQPTGQMSLPSVIEITPPPSIKGAGHNSSSSNGSGGSSHLNTPLDSPLSVHNLIGGSC